MENTATATATQATQSVESVLESLKRQLAALPNQEDVPLTYKAQAEHAAKQSSLTGRIRTIQSATAALAECNPTITFLTEWRSQLLEWREALTAAQPEALSPEALAERKVANRIVGFIDRVDVPKGATYSQVLSIKVIEIGPVVLQDTGVMLETLPLGRMMRESGYTESVTPPPGEVGMRLPWYGSLREVDARLKELQVRKRDAEVRLERAISESVV